ncbi:MAG: sugar transferase, partial [Ignavibacteriaceae bacterium]
MKRFLDVVISLLIIIICVPLIAVILLIVSVVTDDSPLLTQERKIHLTKRGIKIFKIRTIKNSKSFNELEKKSGKVFNKEEYEDYVPLFCRYLRKTGIDELPQVINVLRGEMSLVGP